MKTYVVSSHGEAGEVRGECLRHSDSVNLFGMQCVSRAACPGRLPVVCGRVAMHRV